MTKSKRIISDIQTFEIELPASLAFSLSIDFTCLVDLGEYSAKDYLKQGGPGTFDILNLSFKNITDKTIKNYPSLS